MPDNATAPKGVMPVSAEEPAGKEGISRAQEMISQIVFFVVVVLLIGFAAAFISVITLWVQSFNDKTSSYQDLTRQVQVLENQVDNITKGLQQAKIIK